MSQVEGRNPVRETLKRGGVKKILIAENTAQDPRITEIVEQARRQKIPIERVPKERLDRQSVTGRHQGVIAIVDAPGYTSLRQVLEKAGRTPLILILDGVQDPQNLGNILRTADSAGVDAVVVPKREGVGLTPTVLRVSMGGGAHVPVVRENLYPAVKVLKDEGFKLIAVDASGERVYWNEDLKGAIALVFGGEGEGISPTLLEKCDSSIKIPMYGSVSSLNVGATAAIILYERVRQREISKGL